MERVLKILREFHLTGLIFLTWASNLFLVQSYISGHSWTEWNFFPDLTRSPVWTQNKIPVWEANYNILQRSIGHRSRQPSWAEANSSHPFTSYNPKSGRELSQRTPADLLLQHLRYQIKLQTALLNPHSKAEGWTRDLQVASAFIF